MEWDGNKASKMGIREYLKCRKWNRAMTYFRTDVRISLILTGMVNFQHATHIWPMQFLLNWPRTNRDTNKRNQHSGIILMWENWGHTWMQVVRGCNSDWRFNQNKWGWSQQTSLTWHTNKRHGDLSTWKLFGRLVFLSLCSNTLDYHNKTLTPQADTSTFFLADPMWTGHWTTSILAPKKT